MKAFRGWAITAGLIFAAIAADSQAAPQQAGPPQYQPASDFSGPYADIPSAPPQVVVPEYGPGMPPQAAIVPQYGPGMPPELLPPREVYSVLRENGFSPLGAPRLRGLLYSIAVIDRRGDDGRVVIDARNGRIVRFVPAYHYGEGLYVGPPAYAPYAPLSRFDGPPRPPASVPRVATRTPPPTVPIPKAAPARPGDERPLAEKPAPLPNQQSAAVQMRPANVPQTASAADPAKPAAPAILPTQPMPKVQGLE